VPDAAGRPTGLALLLHDAARFDCRYCALRSDAGRLTLATIEIKPEGAGTRMTLTAQCAYLDGYGDSGSRDRGTHAQKDQLEATLPG
jgi:hypothetical protein